MVDLRSILQGPQNAPSFDLINPTTQKSRIIKQAALQSGILSQDLESRALPDIANEFASRGAFHSGGRNIAQGRARQDTVRALGDINLQKEERIKDLVSLMGLIPFGRRF